MGSLGEITATLSCVGITVRIDPEASRHIITNAECGCMRADLWCSDVHCGGQLDTRSRRDWKDASISCAGSFDVEHTRATIRRDFGSPEDVGTAMHGDLTCIIGIDVTAIDGLKEALMDLLFEFHKSCALQHSMRR